jgi:hypothetical protein
VPAEGIIASETFTTLLPMLTVPVVAPRLARMRAPIFKSA